MLPQASKHHLTFPLRDASLTPHAAELLRTALVLSMFAVPRFLSDSIMRAFGLLMVAVALAAARHLFALLTGVAFKHAAQTASVHKGHASIQPVVGSSGAGGSAGARGW